MKFTSAQIEQTATHSKYAEKQQINPYAGSAMKMYQDLSSKAKGAAFEYLITEVLETQGFTVEKPKKSTDYDRLINGKKVEIKGSLGWVTNGEISHYRFQQLRSAQDYEIVLFLFVTPGGIEIKGASKKVVMNNIAYQDEHGFWPHNQHGGKRVNSGTFCIDVADAESLDWMQPIEEIFQFTVVSLFL